MTPTIPHEGAPLTEAPDAARTASPQRAGRVEKVGEQRAAEGDYEKDAPGAAMLLVPLLAFIITGAIAAVVAG